MRAPTSRAAALSARMRSCSLGSGSGHGNTISSWISPRKSDLVKEVTAYSGRPSSSAWLAASMGHHPTPAPGRSRRAPGPGSVLGGGVAPHLVRAPVAEDLGVLERYARRFEES